MQEWSFRDTFSTPEQMRDVLRTMLDDVKTSLHVDEEPWYDLKIILHELCCNALDHGKAPVEIFSAFCVYDDRLHILVCDRGEGYNPGEPGLADTNAEHGRGLHIVSCLADDLMLNSTANKILVRMQI
ncbi:ATP-binding protein [Christensenellaceae bacterium OttesenSCG-928-L17]|nr:ATP-binding protein [Christensenellaceae bacterium OttesenSCG-928-L17]